MNRDEILQQMRTLQEEYSKLAAELKVFKQQEELELYKKKQLARIEEFKGKYKFYVQETPKPIDWEEVEKLITTSFGQPDGYSLGYNGLTGEAGLVHEFGGSGGTFSPMVEDEDDVRKYNDRERIRNIPKERK